MKTKEQLAEQYMLETDGDAWCIDAFLAGFSAKEKIIKQKLRDKYNHLNSQLKQLNTFKLDKTVNQEQRVILEAKVDLLKELMK